MSGLVSRVSARAARDYTYIWSEAAALPHCTLTRKSLARLPDVGSGWCYGDVDKETFVPLCSLERERERERGHCPREGL